MENLLVELSTIIILSVKFIGYFLPAIGAVTLAGLVYLEITK